MANNSSNPNGRGTENDYFDERATSLHFHQLIKNINITNNSASNNSLSPSKNEKGPSRPKSLVTPSVDEAPNKISTRLKTVFQLSIIVICSVLLSSTLVSKKTGASLLSNGHASTDKIAQLATLDLNLILLAEEDMLCVDLHDIPTLTTIMSVQNDATNTPVVNVVEQYLTDIAINEILNTPVLEKQNSNSYVINRSLASVSSVLPKETIRPAAPITKTINKVTTLTTTQQLTTTSKSIETTPNPTVTPEVAVKKGVVVSKPVVKQVVDNQSIEEKVAAISTKELTKIELKAQQQGKMYFLKFGAKWCTPCKIMEKGTFNNRKVKNYIDDNYLYLNVDVDDIDGRSLKQKYDVKLLPTIIIFNADGEIVQRIEESLSSKKMLAQLEEYNKPIYNLNAVAKKSEKKKEKVKTIIAEIANEYVVNK